MELTDTLRRVPLFNELTEHELRLLAERTVRKRFAAGVLVFSEGDACSELLVVEGGSVKLFKCAPSGREQLMSIERAGSALAETAVFDGGRYSVAACAEEPTILLSLDAMIFRTICSQNPQLAAKVIKVLAYRLRHLDALVEELSFSTVRGRLIAYLLQLAREGESRADGGGEFELKENNEQLAARLGTVRELISRNLGRLHGEGLIQMRRRRVQIASLRRLQDELERQP